jgi:hypothetical protein
MKSVYFGPGVPHYDYKSDQEWRSAQDSHRKLIMVSLYKGMNGLVRAAWDDPSLNEPAYRGFISTRAKVRTEDVTHNLWIGGWKPTWVVQDGNVLVCFGQYNTKLIHMSRKEVQTAMCL